MKNKLILLSFGLCFLLLQSGFKTTFLAPNKSFFVYTYTNNVPAQITLKINGTSYTSVSDGSGNYSISGYISNNYSTGQLSIPKGQWVTISRWFNPSTNKLQIFVKNNMTNPGGGNNYVSLKYESNGHIFSHVGGTKYCAKNTIYSTTWSYPTGTVCP